MGKLYTPCGREIVGTVETLQGIAGITGATRGVNGGFDLDYDGETKIDWNSQETVTVTNRERLFLDEYGEEWPEGRLIYKEDEDEKA